MDIYSLSATAIQSYESCSARFNAEKVDYTPGMSGSAAALGSALHEALEIWVSQGYYLKEFPTIMDREKAMQVIWNMVYYNYFSDSERFSEGWKILHKWIQRMDWMGRTVLELETKKFFMLPSSKGPVKVNYIIDRKDRLDDGSIEVVDYKSIMRPYQPDALKSLVQARLYAVATLIEHKEENLPGVWVTFDQLRYDTVSTFITRSDCEEFWHYLVALAERIYADDGTKETLNPECIYCVRKQNCETLTKHTAGGGVLGIQTLPEVTDRLAVLKYAKKGIDAAIAELEDLGLSLAEQEGVITWDTADTEAKVTSKGRRSAEHPQIPIILGPERMQKWGKMNVGTLEEILKTDPDLTDEERSRLKQLVGKKVFGAPYIELKPKKTFAEE